MTDSKKNMKKEATSYECIDQDLGLHMWRLDLQDTSPDLRSRLETHLKYCADCRIQQRINVVLARGLSDGSIQLKPRANLRLVSQSVIATGFLALAASLFLMFMLPPMPAQQGMAVRGNGGPEIISPVADEVLHNLNPVISWEPLPEATSYNVRIEGVGNDYTWQQETTAAKVAIPAENILPVSERFRVFVEPVPAYLAPAGGWRSSFRSASLPQFVKYRVGAAPVMVQGLGFLALGLLILGATVPLFGKRRLNS